MKKHDKNLIVIMSDEHQGNALSAIGHPFVKTPNIDKLAENGMLFSNAYTSCPICVPARASFATGLPVHKNHRHCVGYFLLHLQGNPKDKNVINQNLCLARQIH